MSRRNPDDPGRQRGSSAKIKEEEPAVRGRGAYLGGHPNEVPRRTPNGDEAVIPGLIAMNGTAIFIIPDRRRGGPPRRAVVPWSNVASVSMESLTEAKSRLGAVLVFGVLGLLAKGTADSTVIAVRLLDGGTVYYQADLNFRDFRANVTPILQSFGVTVTDESTRTPKLAPPVASVADELAKLAQLRDSGVLTEAEFATQKAKLLG